MVARFYMKNGSIADFEKNTDQLLPFLSNNFQLSEKIWFCHNELPLFHQHISLFLEKIHLLKLPNVLLTDNPKELLRISKRLINKNKAFKSGVLEYFFIWNNEKVDTYITCKPNDSGHFPLLENGVLCTYAENEKFSGNPWGTFKFTNEIVWKTLQLSIKNSRYQNLIITNENNIIAECLEANIFFIKDDVLYTPSEDTGCYVDPLREFVLLSAKNLNLIINETAELTQEIVLDMEEAFLASEAVFMQKILGINDKRFIHNKTAQINNQLNKLLGIS